MGSDKRWCYRLGGARMPSEEVWVYLGIHECVISFSKSMNPIKLHESFMVLTFLLGEGPYHS